MLRESNHKRESKEPSSRLTKKVSRIKFCSLFICHKYSFIIMHRIQRECGAFHAFTHFIHEVFFICRKANFIANNRRLFAGFFYCNSAACAVANRLLTFKKYRRCKSLTVQFTLDLLPSFRLVPLKR